MKREKRKTDEFTVEADGGKRFVIYEFTEFLGASSFDNPNALIEGLKSLRTADGTPVNVIGDGEYQIVGSEARLRRV